MLRTTLPIIDMLYVRRYEHKISAEHMYCIPRIRHTKTQEEQSGIR